MRPIVDAREIFSPDTSRHYAAMIGHNRPRSVEIGRWDSAAAADELAVSYVNFGRWVADCPARPCANPVTGERAAGAEYVALGLPFMCQWCWNQDIGGRFREVEFPAAYDAIEAVLVERIEPDTRNWAPGETVADLQIENIAHGVAS